MRDWLLAILLFYFSFKGLQVPWIGIMTWTVVSIMNPHKLSWRLDQWPVAMIVAVTTLVGLLFSPGRKQLPLTRETLALMAFMVWITITVLMSGDPVGNYEAWKKIIKIDFMILVALLVLHSRLHIMALAWMLALSLGFHGFKGGLFTIAHGGSYRVWGPSGSFIEGNNELALALIMAIPLMRFLQMNSADKWVRRGLGAVMVLSAAAALGSHSRGALLAIAAMAFVMWWRSEKKLMSGVVLVTLGIGMIAFMPDHWVARMNTIESYEEDDSATGRINAWWMAWNLAKDRFFGGGFLIYNLQFFGQYAPEPTRVHAAHSVIFQVLGEHGFVGLFLWLLMFWFVWLSAGRLRKDGRRQAQTRWLSDLGAMCQVSMAGYVVGGLFLSLAYFDLPYNILVLVVAGRAWMARQAWIEEDKADAVEAAQAADRARYGKPSMLRRLEALAVRIVLGSTRPPPVAAAPAATTPATPPR